LDVGSWVAHPVDLEDPIADRVASNIEPAPAAVDMAPALEMDAFGIAAHEQVVGPPVVGQLRRLLRSHDVRLAAAMKLGLVTLATPGAGDQEHG
jgi:hypothetical protein